KETLKGEGMTLTLERTPDILAELGRRKKNTLLVGFALETENERENALRKLREKNADMIVLNNPRVEGAGFGGDTNVATLLLADGASEELAMMGKAQLAELILDRALSALENRR
ncbi:MAG: bifunctional 4'-phosphopantothenoylcysteine decarboxylase/phosphopantothenoylcysteine synthetase, partial [Bacteroidetes bacterium]|nr:bifunctional 4'-phosphopantothenoylcysteine decarboxylase/phosphopantothenoylcysteine synthetase [Bacteroidota bacterium]